MALVAHLLTFVDIAHEHDDDHEAGTTSLSLSARHEAVLADGRRILLLDDRGWNERDVTWGDKASARESALVKLTTMWAGATMEELERTARDVVGPDEPFDGRAQADMEASHWGYLARIMGQRGVDVDADDLSALPHVVEFSDRLLTRLGGDARPSH